MDTWRKEEMDKRCEYIKAKDRTNLESVITIFQSRGFDVYLVGSAFISKDYKDIDLLLGHNKSSEFPAPVSVALDDCIGDLEEMGAKTTEKGGRYAGYGGSTVEQRYLVILDGTSFDIFYACDPFDRMRLPRIWEGDSKDILYYIKGKEKP